ncbi:hypothetical protein PC9H_010892 [Pleurotus ostreatus]|uniref:Chromo domain-containing protein n=2 Tax=Pleurotus TaxID=5320 RepID=A0A8H6ZKP9_PLEOS|nr:uncharacterized protein PC9H_010892 [Pleurotus ostreatus]KAF7422735.1 hypothetical protein PC9H_010892 [Pleurotus ostreatus]KAG9227418.1 hypothetical protein CCMSSC00406_0004043 [Pleurotus cornucopiae]
MVAEPQKYILTLPDHLAYSTSPVPERVNPPRSPGSLLYDLTFTRKVVTPVVKLSPFVPDPISGRRPVAPPPPQLVDREEEHEVEEVRNSRRFGRVLKYLVRWRGYGIEHDSWEPASNPRKVKDFHDRHPDAVRVLWTSPMSPTTALPLRMTPAALDQSWERWRSRKAPGSAQSYFDIFSQQSGVSGLVNSWHGRQESSRRVAATLKGGVM